MLCDNRYWTDVESEGRFRRCEFKDDPYKMRQGVVNIVRRMRIEAGKPCSIHCGWADGKGHASSSEHYDGNAVDLHFKDMILAEQVKLAYKHGASGIGAYPGWNNPGIHVDDRKTKGKKACYWMEPLGKKGTGQYAYYDTVFELMAAIEELTQGLE